MGVIHNCDAFNWKIIDASSLGEHSGSIEAVREKEFAGILIENLLSPSEISSILEGVKNQVPNNRKVFKEEVTLYPRGFAAYLDSSVGNVSDDLKLYLEHGERYIQEFQRFTNVDFHSILSSVFNQLSSESSYGFLKGDDEIGYFVPSQIRAFHPNKSAIPVHNGNVFQKMYQDFYSAMSSRVVIKNQMSYFIMLQEPEFGGELTLFDMPWNQKQEMAPSKSIITETGESRNLVDDPGVQKTVVKPSPGDMIIFMGGDIWHNVGPFTGALDRITLGGFFSFLTNGSKIVSWA
jgi:hypothetical protein